MHSEFNHSQETPVHLLQLWLLPRDKDLGFAHQVYLRQPGHQLVMQVDGRKVEESMDLYHAVVECYPGAIYLSQGASYEVLELNRDARRIELREKETHYYTVPLGQTHVEILAVYHSARELPPLESLN